MQSVSNPNSFRRSITDPELEVRLNWLLSENALAGQRGRTLYEREEEEMLMMRRPVAAEKAYATLGLLLGTFPPAAIFYKIFGRAMGAPEPGFIFLFFIMNVFCALAGLYMGSRLSRMASAAEDSHWLLTLASALCLGGLWGAATGAVGGLPAFGIGALFGAACAIPVGALAFALFMPLHRLLARGGMIDARHLWPLACGVVAIVTALILGL